MSGFFTAFGVHWYSLCLVLSVLGSTFPADRCARLARRNWAPQRRSQSLGRRAVVASFRFAVRPRPPPCPRIGGAGRAWVSGFFTVFLAYIGILFVWFYPFLIQPVRRIAAPAWPASSPGAPWPAADKLLISLCNSGDLGVSPEVAAAGEIANRRFSAPARGSLRMPYGGLAAPSKAGWCASENFTLFWRPNLETD